MLGRRHEVGHQLLGDPVGHLALGTHPLHRGGRHALCLACLVQPLARDPASVDDAAQPLECRIGQREPGLGEGGIQFGPSSLEAEDNLLRLDRTIARLLSALDARVGLDNTIIVLSSDHGGPEAPGGMAPPGAPGGYG